MTEPHRHCIHVINGPNLNAIGRREGYGPTTLAELEEDLISHGLQSDVDVRCFQTNSEADLLNYLYRIEQEACCVILNPGAFGHTSLALADCLATISITVIEVHITNLYARPDRPTTLTGGHAMGVIMGFGVSSYFQALNLMMEMLEMEDEMVGAEIAPIPKNSLN